MNTTTTTSSYTYTIGPDYYDQFYALFVNPVVAIRFYQIGYTFTFLLGFTGNTASLLTFSRPTLRKVSTGCLFIALAISDILYLLMCIFDYLEFGFSVPFYRRVAYNELCRFRAFVMYVAQLASSWLLVFVSLDRWIRTRFPFKSNSICTPKKVLIAVGVLLVIDVGLHSHILTSMFGMLIPAYVNGACGATLGSPSYMVFYYLTWTAIQIFTTCLIPAFLMLIILLDIFIHIRIRKRAVAQAGQGVNQHQANLQKQMFILMFTSICIFLITNLPLGIYKIISPRGNEVVTDAALRTTVWTGLGWFQSLNYAINFYIHCLTSTLFRKEFKQQIKYFIGEKHDSRNLSIEVPRTNALRTQTQLPSIQ